AKGPSAQNEGARAPGTRRTRRGMSRSSARAAMGVVLLFAACRNPARTSGAPGASGPAPSADPSAAPPWASGPKSPATPEGMVWIPPGALVAGTPTGVLPRIPDQEMAGEQVILKGFFMSIYAYPNEEGAIPL